MESGEIKVILGVVHVAMDGTKTLEIGFEDDQGNYGQEIEVSPDGTMKITSQENE